MAKVVTAIGLCLLSICSSVCALPFDVTTIGHDGGAVIARAEVSMETSNVPITFGPRFNGSYQYDGSTIGAVTNGRTNYQSSSEIDATDSNDFRMSRSIESFGQINAYSGAGMESTQVNQPVGLCETDLSLGLGNITFGGAYPGEQHLDAEIGFTGSGNSNQTAVFKDSVIWSDEVVGLSGTYNAPRGTLTLDKIGSAHKGFDKNSSAGPNFNYDTHENYALSTQDGIGGSAAIDVQWMGFSDAYQSVLEENTTVNSSVNQTES